ncbi:hypothetical protein ACW73L_15975 [Methylolobus aquaticus]
MLLRCFAGCDVPSIVAAVGLDLAALFPPRDNPDNRYSSAKPRAPRIDLRALFDAIEHDLNVLSLALTDIADGMVPSPADAEHVAACAANLADQIRVARQ